MTPEKHRLDQASLRLENWKRWGPYLSERQWGTVREDYSPEGNAWGHFSRDQAPSRAYRWGEDGLLGWSDRQCRLCFSPVLWNGKDPILKERLFGLTGQEGNHGEDVKDHYYYLESSPTHSYTKALYKYPQKEFPYLDIISTNLRRGLNDSEYELDDTDIFEENRYFDVETIVAKESPEDLYWVLRVTNRGPEKSSVHLLPSLWFRNTWSWGEHSAEAEWGRPSLRLVDGVVHASHSTLGDYIFEAREENGDSPVWLFTENETNHEKLFNGVNASPYCKDGIQRRVVEDDLEAVNPRYEGTKCAAWFQAQLEPGETREFHCRLRSKESVGEWGLQEVLRNRRSELEEFYEGILPSALSPDEFKVARQGYAGLLWTKQFYYYGVKEWLRGDGEKGPQARHNARNQDWSHLYAREIISMPDKWEYPWFAAWDLAFHMIPFAKVDPHFAKRQLLTLLREWYLHPNGQLPAYEWNFSDVNPPVHAWAVWEVYQQTRTADGGDLDFLEKCFQKLLINFTWWVNRKDDNGNHIFSGGFLGLDNIGVFDRSHELPGGGSLNQADGTAWMGFYCLNMLEIAIELAQTRPAYEDIASKFFEHFIRIADAMNSLGETGLWNEEDGFYYDQFVVAGENPIPMKVRSMVGLLPLMAVVVLDQRRIDKLPGFKKRMEWFLKHRKDLSKYLSYCESSDDKSHLRLLALPSRNRLTSCLEKLFSEEEFLSPFGVRSLSKTHEASPFVFHWGGKSHQVAFNPGASDSHMFGGNSNWRGPVWFPVNYILIQALKDYSLYYGDELKVNLPDGQSVSLKEGAKLIESRLLGLFLEDEEGRRPCHGGRSQYEEEHWKDLILFYEYFHSETGKGLGANHQTGWTALVLMMLEDSDK